MGASNVKAAYVLWGRLPDRAFRLLTYMALVSLDGDGESTKARRYFAGRADLAAALGRAVPDEPDEADQSPPALTARRARHAAFEAVRGALAELRRVGAIREVRRGGFRFQSEYELVLDLWTVQAEAQGEPAPTSTQVEDQEQGEPAPTTQGEPGSQEQGEPARRSRVSLPPRNHVGTTDEESRGQPHLLRSSNQGAGPLLGSDDEYEAARALLTQAGPDAYGAAMAEAHERNPDASTRDVVLAVASSLRAAS